jgi:hypothetical protein
MEIKLDTVRCTPYIRLVSTIGSPILEQPLSNYSLEPIRKTTLGNKPIPSV